MNEVKLYTAWCDYGATGEGRTIAVCINYAASEAAMADSFQATHGFAADHIVAGVAADEPLVTYALSPRVLNDARDLTGRASIAIKAHIHFSMS